MHHHFLCIPPPKFTGKKKQLQHGEQVALLFASIPMTRLQVYLCSPIAKVSRPRVAPIKQHGSIFHPSIFCGSSSSDFCRRLPGICYAAVRHLCILGRARVGFASLFTKAIQSQRQRIRAHCQCRPQGLVSAGSGPNPTRRIGGSGHLKSRDQAWVLVGVYACAKLASGWYMLVRLHRGSCCGTSRLCACTGSIPRRAASFQLQLQQSLGAVLDRPYPSEFVHSSWICSPCPELLAFDSCPSTGRMGQ